MQLDYATVERHGPIAVVRFDRRGSLNAFNQKLVRELTHVARSFHDDLETHAVVLTGATNAFSAGADLRDRETWSIEDASDLEKRHVFYGGVRLCRAWEEMPQLTVCAMERLSVGAGVASDGNSRSIDMTLTPSALTGGVTPSPSTTSWRPRTPSIFAMVGPFKSASRTPTFPPSRAKQFARLAVIEDLPTPPLPDTTATMDPTVASRSRSRACWTSTWPAMFDPPSPARSL